MEGALAPWHIIVLAVVLVVVFGSKRLPEASRSIGQSLRILKAETRGTATGEVVEPAPQQLAPPPQGQPYQGQPQPPYPGQQQPPPAP